MTDQLFPRILPVDSVMLIKRETENCMNENSNTNFMVRTQEIIFTLLKEPRV